MHERSSERARAGDRRWGLWIGSVATLVLLVGVWIAASAQSPRQQPLGVSSGSSGSVIRSPAPTRRPVVAPTPSQPTAREIELFGRQLQLTIPAGTYSDSRHEATIDSPSMRVQIERWDAGTSHTIARGISGLVSGSTLQEVADAVESLLESGGATYARRTTTIDYHEAVQWVASMPIPTDGRPFMVSVVIDGSTVYLVEGFGTGPILEGIALARFISLQTSINFLTPSDITALGGRVSLRLPGTMHVDVSTPRVLRLDAEQVSFGLGWPLSIHRVPLGARTSIILPGEDGGQAVVAGRTLRDIVASLERTSDGTLRKTDRATMTIGGRAGYAWTFVVDTPLSEWFGTLHARLGVVLVGRNAYVVIGDDDDLVKSIRFLR